MRQITTGLILFLGTAATAFARQTPEMTIPGQSAAATPDSGLIFATWMLVLFTAALVLVTIVYTYFTREAVKEAKATRDVLAKTQDALANLYKPAAELTEGIKRVSSHFHIFNELFSAIPHPDQLADMLILTLANQADATAVQAEMFGAMAEYIARERRKPALTAEIQKARYRLTQRIPVQIKLFSRDTVVRETAEN